MIPASLIPAVPARGRIAEVIDLFGLPHALLAARARAWLPSRRLTVLGYHRVGRVDGVSDPDLVDATAAEFERHVVMLKRYFTIVDTRSIDSWREGVPPPPNPALITFDDGYRDNHDVALPILRRHGVSATFFIATAYVDERRLFWWEKLRWLLGRSKRSRVEIGYPEARSFHLDTDHAREATARSLTRIIKDRYDLDLDRLFADVEAATDVRLTAAEERRLADDAIMSWDHVRALRAAGMDVQSHGHEHRLLGTLDPRATEQDLLRARSRLEQELSAPVHAIAYPAGRGLAVAPSLRPAIARAGYRLGFTSGTGIGRIGGQQDWLDLRRLSMDATMTSGYLRASLAFPPLAY